MTTKKIDDMKEREETTEERALRLANMKLEDSERERADLQAKIAFQNIEHNKLKEAHHELSQSHLALSSRITELRKTNDFLAQQLETANVLSRALSRAMMRLDQAMVTEDL